MIDLSMDVLTRRNYGFNPLPPIQNPTWRAADTDRGIIRSFMDTFVFIKFTFLKNKKKYILSFATEFFIVF